MKREEERWRTSLRCFFLREMKRGREAAESPFGKISCPVNKRSEMRCDACRVLSTSPGERLDTFLFPRTVIVIPPTSEFVYFLLLF